MSADGAAISGEDHPANVTQEDVDITQDSSLPVSFRVSPWPHMVICQGPGFSFNRETTREIYCTPRIGEREPPMQYLFKLSVEGERTTMKFKGNFFKEAIT